MFSAGSDLSCAGCCLSPHQQKNIFIVHAERALGPESDARHCMVLCILKNMNLSLTMANNPQKTVRMFFIFRTCSVLQSYVISMQQYSPLQSF